MATDEGIGHILGNKMIQYLCTRRMGKDFMPSPNGTTNRAKGRGGEKRKDVKCMGKLTGREKNKERYYGESDQKVQKHSVGEVTIYTTK